MPGLLLLPALLAAAAAAAWSLAPRGPAGRRLALAAALAAGLLAAAPGGIWDTPWLLLGARTGLDAAGRAALVAAAGLLLLTRGAGPAGRPDPALAWRALAAGGLCAAAVAFDAAALAAGHVASLLAAYGLAARGPGGRPAAARFMAAAVAGEVLLVDALAEYGHAAESAHLDAMRDAAGGELGPAAPLLLVAAFGLPLVLAGVERLAAPAGVIAAVGALATSRLAADPSTPGAQVAALALLGFGALAGLSGLAGRVARGRQRPVPAADRRDPGGIAPSAAGHPAEVARAAAAAPGAPAALLARLEGLEGLLARATASGLLLLAILVALVFLLGG